jgi:small subunit ribosomal protein S10
VVKHLKDKSIMLRRWATMLLRRCSTSSTRAQSSETTVEEADRLFRRIHVETRGHDKAVLKSYTTFLQVRERVALIDDVNLLQASCRCLSICVDRIENLPYVRWVQPCLRSKFAGKKYKLHYETRTYINRLHLANVTGSTASTWLEYVQRNVPEGVAMKVTFDEIVSLPTSISGSD